MLSRWASDSGDPQGGKIRGQGCGRDQPVTWGLMGAGAQMHRVLSLFPHCPCLRSQRAAMVSEPHYWALKDLPSPEHPPLKLRLAEEWSYSLSQPSHTKTPPPSQKFWCDTSHPRPCRVLKSTCHSGPVARDLADSTEKQHLCSLRFLGVAAPLLPPVLLKFPATSCSHRFAQQVPECKGEEGGEISEITKRPPRYPIIL